MCLGGELIILHCENLVLKVNNVKLSLEMTYWDFCLFEMERNLFISK